MILLASLISDYCNDPNIVGGNEYGCDSEPGNSDIYSEIEFLCCGVFYYDWDY